MAGDIPSRFCYKALATEELCRESPDIPLQIKKLCGNVTVAENI
jgi:hypothetical protein